MALRAVFVIAFCIMILGAAGFSKEIEPMAWPLYLGGFVVTMLSGFFLRAQNKRATGDGAAESTSFASLTTTVAGIRDAVKTIEAEAPRCDRTTLLARLDDVLTDCALLGQRNEEYMKALGPERYVAVWDGFATAERLLARAWSMTADGYQSEAQLELPRARAALERATAGA